MTTPDDQRTATAPLEAIIREMLMEGRTPLAVVVGMTDLLLADTAALSEEHQAYLRAIQVNAARLAHLSNKHLVQFTAFIQARADERT